MKIKLFLYLIFLFGTSNAFAFEITKEEQLIKLDKNTFFSFTTKDFNLNEVDDLIWTKSDKGGNFGLLKQDLWLKYDFNNSTDSIQEKYLFLPFFFVNKIDIYQKVNGKIKLINQLGSHRPSTNNDKTSKGWVTKIKFPTKASSIYIHVEHIYLPIRVNAFIVSSRKLDRIIINSYNIYWFWKGVFIFAFLLSIIVYFFLKQKVFLYYFLFNFGIFITLNIEFGDLHSLFKNDELNRIVDIQRMANFFFIYFFPLFLNEIIAIKANNKKMWKLMQYGNLLFIFLWLINIFSFIRTSEFYFYSTYYFLAYAVIVFIIQLYFLLKALILKEKNAVVLFIIYLVFILFTIFDGYAQTFGFVKDGLYIYRNILYSSMFQIVAFLLFISYKLYQIYSERNNLVIIQGKHDLDMIRATVKSQEAERNFVGRELHDMVGANLAVVKQKIEKSDATLVKLIDDTIDLIRNLSHGLISPNLNHQNFEIEVKDMLSMFETDVMKVKYYFHYWPNNSNKTILRHIYRIVQELMQNATKHSKATEVYIQFLNHDNYLTIMYEDNGVGFETTNKDNFGRGLLNIQNRISLIKAKIDFDSSKNGTTVTIEINKGVEK